MPDRRRRKLPIRARRRSSHGARSGHEYYREQVASHGGYVYHYSPDLSVRWGEGLATKDQIWVQPPGTPTVGFAFTSAYQATGDQAHLDAARAAARALMHGQLKSGGWTNFVDFDPASKRVGNYLRGGGHKKGNNFSTLDDGITPAALRFLMYLDYVQEFKDAELHAAVTTGLDALSLRSFPAVRFLKVGSSRCSRPRPPSTQASRSTTGARKAASRTIGTCTTSTTGSPARRVKR
ncbi:MAG: hypothetical protein QM775_32115 [Pirellulales bacterium]